MALQNSPNIYNGGAVVFDSRPHTALALNLLARKAAKDEAIDQYYKDFDKQVNPAGMDAKDVKILLDNENQRKSFFQQHRDAIKNPRLDGGQAQTAFDGMFKESLGLISESKDKVAKGKQAMDIAMDLKKIDALPESFMADYETHMAPIRGANRTDFDLGRYANADQPYDYTKHLDRYKNFKPVPLGNPTITKDAANFTRTTTTKLGFDDDTKDAIAETAATAYNTSPRYKKLIDGVISDPQKVAALNAFSKEQFGHEIDVAHPEQLAAAYDLSHLQFEKTDTKTVDDKLAYDKMNFEQQKAIQDRGFAQQKQMQANAFANAKKLAQFRKSLGGDGEGGNNDETWLDGHINSLIGEAKQSYEYRSDNGVTHEFEIPLDATIAKALSRGNVEPDKLLYDKSNDTFRPVFYKRDAKGEASTGGGFNKINQTLSVPISRSQLKLGLGIKSTSAKQRAAEMQIKPNKSSKKGSYDDL